MAERLKQQLLEEEKSVDLIVGPDAYRDLPGLLDQVEEGQKAINVLLSTRVCPFPTETVTRPVESSNELISINSASSAKAICNFARTQPVLGSFQRSR